MLKKMTSNDSMTTSVENKKGGAGIIQLFASLPLSAKFCLLVLAALIPRVIVFLQPQIITNDGMLYVNMARLFSEGKYAGTPGSYFNLYPLLIFLVQKVIGDWELSGQLISMMLGTLTVIPVYLLGRSLYDEKAGALSAIFYITLPNLLKFDTQVVRDPTFWFFVLFTVWFVWEGHKKNRLSFFALASLSAGLGASTRVEGFILWAVLGLYMVFKRRGGISVKRKTMNTLLFILIFPLLLFIFAFSVKGSSSRMALEEISSFSVNFIAAHARTVLRPQDPIDAMGEKTYFSLPMISQDALTLASRHRITLAISEVIYKFIKSANFLIILVLLGLWKRRKEGFSSSDRYLFYTFAALFLMSVFYARQLYYFSTRHGVTLALPCLFFAAHGLEAAVGVLSRTVGRLNPGKVLTRKYLFPVLFFLLIVVFLSQGLDGKGKEKTMLKEAGLWLKDNGYQGLGVMGPKRFLRLAFYANGRFVEMPDSWEKVAESIRKNSVRIVTVDSCTIEQDCPDCFESWSSMGLFQIKSLEKEEEKCAIQIYAVP